jgi:AcrR family transcriptional regulator
MPEPDDTSRRERKPRRDAELNRERVLSAAVSAMAREGRQVPIATIAADAGVGVGTLYRRYPDRDALLQALEHRAYALLEEILQQADDAGVTGRTAIGTYLTRAARIRDHLVLPLHGAPPLMSTDAVDARRRISERLDALIERGRADGSITAAVNATDVIIFSALTTRPLAHGPDWTHTADRQIAIFLNGLGPTRPVDIPAPALTRDDIERTFQAWA